MSDHTAIAKVGEKLIKLLQEKIKDEKIKNLIPNEKSIVLASPGEIGKEVRLSLYLYQVVGNVQLNNQEMQNIDNTRLRFPPLMLDLYYMLTAQVRDQNENMDTDKTMKEHQILGWAIQVLNDKSILDEKDLPENLAENDFNLHIILNPTSLDDMTKIWNTFQGKPFRASVCYLVTPVNIESTRVVSEKRVASKKLRQGLIMPKAEEE